MNLEAVVIDRELCERFVALLRYTTYYLPQGSVLTVILIGILICSTFLFSFSRSQYLS